MSSGMPFGFGAGDPEGSGQGSHSGAGQGPFDMASLGAMLQQLGQALQQPGAQGSSDPVNWTLVVDTARTRLAGAVGAEPIAAAEAEWVESTARIADLWLDEATTLPASGAAAMALQPMDWIVQTMPAWRRYVDPLAGRMIDVLGSATGSDLSQLTSQDLAAALPEQFRQMLPEGITPQMMAMLQPMLGVMRQLSVTAFSMQLGQVLADLAGEVVSAGDIGIPLQESSQVAMIPANVAGFGAGIGVGEAEVRIYLTLRESAHQRLFAHVPWLRGRLAGAIEEVAGGVQVDADRLQQAIAEVDMSDPQALQHLMSSGLLQPEQTERQRAALARLQTMLALVEGWVEDVVATAADGRLSAGGALREMVARRRAAGGPAERAFGNLVGLQVRPKAVREATNLFAAVREMRDAGVRDGLWAHPDLLPDADGLADPLGFVERLAD